MKKIFLSYSTKDTAEVDRFDRELRRRGVPLWRDQYDLTGGRGLETEIEAASRDAVGTVFYLTESAAESEWVREKERGYALAARDDRSASVVPIYRDPLAAVGEKMKRLATDQRNLGAYDLSGFQGFVIDGDLNSELKRAADRVLGSLFERLDATKPPNEPWTLGLVTRGGVAPEKFSPDLMLDWSADYPDDPNNPKAPTVAPGRDTWKVSLWPALAALTTHRRRFLGDRKLRIVAQCHLTMALAFGFAFRRNTGIGLQVIEPHSGNLWDGPAIPEEPDYEAWTVHRLDVGSGSDLALAINITQATDSFVHQMRETTRNSNVGKILIFEPASGTSLTALKNLQSTEVHRRTMAVIETLKADPNFPTCNFVHLYFVGPPALAILLAQQLSNVCAVQTYEWMQSRRGYVPGCLLESS